MAKMTVRSTFALDPNTVEALDRLSSRWKVSKSEVFRRLVNTAALIEEADAASDAFAALEELQARFDLDEEKAEEWIRRIRAERTAARP